jgi:predicted nucleotidyltransferase
MAELIPSERISDIRRIANTHGITRVRVFGSRASGVARKTSDLDLLVDLQPERDLLDLVAFKLALEDHLGCRVDVLTEASLSPYLRKLILRDARPLWSRNP